MIYLSADYGLLHESSLEPSKASCGFYRIRSSSMSGARIRERIKDAQNIYAAGGVSPRRLSDSQLLRGLGRLRGRERETTLQILRLLGEVEKRRLYLSEGYGSLYDYCTKGLGYSPSSAMRRISSARCVAKYSEFAGMLKKGEISLCSIARIATVINDRNRTELTSRARGKSFRKVNEIVASYNPRTSTRESVRPVFILKRTEDGESEGVISKPEELSENDSAAGKPSDDSAIGKPPVEGTCGGNTANSARMSEREMAMRGVGGKKFTADVGGESEKAGESTDFMLEKKFRLTFAVDCDMMEKIKLAKSLLSGRFPEGVSFEDLFQVLLDEYLDRHSPQARSRRRKEKEHRKAKIDTAGRKTGRCGVKKRWAETGSNGVSPKAVSKKVACQKTLSRKKIPRRTIPQSVRDEVFIRDGGRCTFVSASGVRCNCRHDLEIDHIVPFAGGGDNSTDNLRLLCAKHNLLEAERIYGKDRIERFYRDPFNLEAEAVWPKAFKALPSG